MTNHLAELPTDPLGYLEAVREALDDPDRSVAGAAGERAALRVLVAIGRCRLFGVEPLPAADETLTTEALAAAERELARLLPGWTTSAQTLGERWDAMDDSWEADELCAALIELRTDLFGAELVLAEMHYPLHAAQAGLGAFDAALAEQLPVLGTLVGSTWLSNFRAALALDNLVALPWWLGPLLDSASEDSAAAAAATLPSAPSWIGVRATRWWQRMVPRPEANGLLAAAPEREQVEVGTRCLQWHSPDGSYVARLNVPARLTAADDVVQRPLNVLQAADLEQAVALAGEPVALGAFRATIGSDAKVWLTLEQVREGCDGRLFIGRDRAEWRPEVEEAP